jgi:hypothetical protein
VPSLALADLCGMLWDMVRYQNFDEKSPYNREAAAWAQSQSSFPLPIDDRPIRDKLVKPAPAAECLVYKPVTPVPTAFDSPQPKASWRPAPATGDIVQAELVAASASTQPEIFFIE